MQKRTLPRLAGAGWVHPYGHGPFAPWYADGGDGDDSGSNDGGDGSGDDSGTDDDQDDDTGGTGDDDQDDDDQGKDDDTAKAKPPAKKAAASSPSRRDKELERARDQAAKARVTAKEAGDKAKAELVQEIGKALGLVKDEDKAPDPAALTAQIEKATAAHRETAVELAVYRGASKYGADPDALTDSRAFLNSIKGLDPSEDGFAKKVQAAIKQAVTDNPKLKAQGLAPARSSGDFSGGAGDTTRSGPKTIDDIRAERRKRRAG
ncbi:hypothetical protein QBB34_21390 [Streptomyces stelliscabiei]|uniref:hypothetical protein n=1 Tax=Streptomyces stelliscabiei TaxID=146820 RepID=UPI002FEF1ADD